MTAPRVFTLLCILAAPVAWAGAVSSPVAIDPGATAAQPYGDQISLRTATFDGGAFFVWEDYRTGGIWPDVRGLRIAFDGGVLDSDAFLIAGGPLDQQFGDVACAEAVCLVAWRNHDRVEAARFALNGARLDSTPVVLRTGTVPISAVSAGTNGSEFLVAWGHGSDLEVQLVGLDGVPIGALAALNRSGDLRTSAIASDGNGWEIAWSEYAAPSSENTRCVKFDPPASFTAGPQILTTSSFPTFPDVAAAGSDGGGYIVVWHTYQPAVFTGDVLAKRLDTTGIQAGGTLTISSNFTQGFPSVAFDGTNYNIVYRSPTSGLELRLVDNDGGRSAPVQLQSGGQSGLPAIATSESSPPVIAWSENYGTGLGADVRHGSLTTAGLTPSNGVATLSSGNNQTEAALAWGADEFFIVWQDDRGGRNQIWGARTSALGQPLGAPFRISDPDGNDHVLPAVSFDGENFVVAWRAILSNAVVLLTRVSPQGVVLDAPKVASSLFSFDGPSVASDDAGSYVVWSALNGGNGEDVFIMRVDKDGGLVDPIDTKLIGGNTQETDPHAVIANDGLCVSFTNVASTTVIQSFCWGDGYPGNTTSNRSVGIPSLAVQWPALVRGPGSDVLFFGAPSTYDAIEGREWRRDGGSEASFTVLAPAETPLQYRGLQSKPRAVFDGINYDVAFERVSPDSGTDLILRRFHQDAGLAGSVVIADSAEEERMAAVATGTPGRVGIAYSAFDPASQRMKLYFRTWSEVAAGLPCTVAAECAGGRSCVANVCGGDAGVVSDAGVSDGAGGLDDGGSSDGGSTPPGERGRLGVGCGCAQSSGAWVLAFALAATIAVRRRRWHRLEL